MTTRDEDHEPLLYSPHDEAHYEALARDAIQAVKAMDGALHGLATATVEGRSRDGRVAVRVTGSGAVSEVRLRGGALRQYSAAKLGEVVARTLRATQHRAREAYERDAAALTPPALAECERLIERTNPRPH